MSVDRLAGHLRSLRDRESVTLRTGTVISILDTTHASVSLPGDGEWVATVGQLNPPPVEGSRVLVARQESTCYIVVVLSGAGDPAGGGGGAVSSVNGATGAVVLTAGSVGADPAGTAAALVGALTIPTTLDSLTDVATTGAATGQALVYTAGSGWAPGSVSGGGGVVLIDEQSPSGVASVTFGSIPDTYRGIRMEYVARSTAASNDTSISITLNGDATDANYRWKKLNLYGSASPGEGNGANRTVFYLPGASAPSASAGTGTLSIIEHAGTIFRKQASAEYRYRFDTSSLQECAGLLGIEWASTAPVTQITAALAAGNFVAGSKIRLYGIA